MRVLIACESSGVVREAFRALGHSAYSCDLLPAEDGSDWHIQQDVREVVRYDTWDLMIAHPPCTYLSSSGMHWTARGLRDPMLTESAIGFFMLFTRTEIPHVAIENPVGVMSTRYRKPDQYIQPYQFGEDASKKTGLWLHNLPPLVHTEYVEPRMVNGKPRWSNQTDSGQNKLGPSSDRWKVRSSTYPGIAKAMAEQWTKYIEGK